MGKFGCSLPLNNTVDISFNNLSNVESLNNIKNIQRIRLENVNFNQVHLVIFQNSYFEIFLNENLIELDYSQNNLGNIFEKFRIMTKIESLILKKVNLQSMEQIQFQNFIKLKKLDN